MKTGTKIKTVPRMILAVLTAVCMFSSLLPGKTVYAASAPDYSLIFDADYYYDKYEDLQKACGENPFRLFNHFLVNGMREGRQASKHFNVYDYAANNLDLIIRFGTSDLSKYYMQYITEGYEEGRNCETPYSPSNNPSGGGAVDADTLNGYVDSLVDMINQARTSMGVDGLGNASDVSAAAAARAKDLLSSYSHTRPNGKSYKNALDVYGVSYTDAYEVIASGLSSPSDVMYDWTRSSDISSNLTSKTYKYIGIGCASDADGKLYWALLLTY